MSVIPPLPNPAKRVMRVQYLNFGCQALGLGYSLQAWALAQPMVLLHRTASASLWVADARASTHMRTCPRPLGHHLFPTVPFSSPSVPVHHPGTHIEDL